MCRHRDLPTCAPDGSGLTSLTVIWPELAARRPQRRHAVGNVLGHGYSLAVPDAGSGSASGVDPQQAFAHAPIFLAAVTRLLCSRAVGARGGSPGAVWLRLPFIGGTAYRKSI